MIIFIHYLHFLLELAEVESDRYSETLIQQVDESLDKIDTVSREEHIKNVQKIREANA